MPISPNDPALHRLVSDAIRASTDEVFSTMVGLSVVAGPPTIEQQPPSAQSGTVALIGLAGGWSGTGCVACSATLACKLAGQFLSTKYEAVDDEVLDALGEIANMIIGNVKGALEEPLGPMGLSSPTIIYGRNLHTRSARVHDWTVVPFDCGEERMFVQVCIAPMPEPTRRRAGFSLAQTLQVADPV
jgi:chemotaxis protein CheX